MSHQYAAYQEPAPLADGPQTQDSRNRIEDTGMSLENGDDGKLPPENGSRDDNKMEE